MKRLFINLSSSSVLWGLALTFGFYYAISQGFVQNETIKRYTTGHPVEYVTIAMFLIGLCDLTFKLLKTRRERRALRRGALFPPKKHEKEPLANVPSYLDAVVKARDVRGESSYLSRLADALDFLRFGGAPDELDHELRRLADDAYDRRDADYGMARAFIWAIPILGFLGTVLGITVALGSLDLTQLDATSEKLADGLKVAFDTTALSLSLVFVLFFLQFFSRKQDALLERRVARLVDSELKGRFYDDRDQVVEGASPDAGMVRLFAAALDEAFTRQTTQWNATVAAVAEQLGAAFDKRLCEGSGAWTQTLADAQRQFVDASLTPALNAASEQLVKLDALAEKIERQTEALRQTLQATADVTALEERLAQSLEKLAEVGEFEKTLNNLSATVCLLNSKLTSGPQNVALAEERRRAKRQETLAALNVLSQQDALEDALYAELDPTSPPPMKPLADEQDEPLDKDGARTRRRSA